MNNATGFNPEIVNNSINGVIEAYQHLINALGTNMQSTFVDQMATTWACTKAKEFFKNAFLPAINPLIESCTKTFTNVAGTMGEAGIGWASDTGTDYVAPELSPIEKEIDSSNILENIGGIRGIDLAAATNIVGQLPNIVAEANSALSEAKSAVSSSGYLGGDQNANLNSSLSTIQTSISETVESLINQTKEAIEQTVEQYGDTAGKISEAFTIH